MGRASSKRPGTEGIRRALEAARSGDRHAFAQALASVALAASPRASAVEMWLRAEQEYQRGNFRAAVDLFGRFEHQTRDGHATPWQRYRSSQRRSFAHLQLGSPDAAARCLQEAQERLRSDPRLAKYAADLEALHAHLLETSGDPEGARGRFELAYEVAQRARNFQRAATTAADVARILGAQGRPADGLAWIERASVAARKVRDQLVRRTIQVRRSMLFNALRRFDEAADVCTQVIAESADGLSNSALVSAYATRADTKHARGDFPGAEADFHRAIDTCAAQGHTPHEVLHRKNLAALLLEYRTVEATRQAQIEFREGLKRALSFKPPPSWIILQLGEDVLLNPVLVGRDTLPERLRDDLEHSIARLKDLLRPLSYQRGPRTRRITLTQQHLLNALHVLVPETIELKSCTVSVTGARAYSKNGVRPIAPNEIATLRAILEAGTAGLCLNDLDWSRSSRSRGAMVKSLQRLGKAIGDDLRLVRKGRKNYFYVQRAPSAREPKDGSSS